LRVVSDQPWEVTADVLAVPFVGEPRFDGVLAEIDRRAGGELAALAAFGELKPSATARRSSCRGSSAPAGLAIGAGDAETITRQVVVRIGSAIERRLAVGASSRSPSGWATLGIGSMRSGRVAELPPGASSKGEFRAGRHLSRRLQDVPPALDELILVRARLRMRQA